MIVSARPMMNPFITGSEMKLARKPRRRSPATERQRSRRRAPVVIVSWDEQVRVLGGEIADRGSGERRGRGHRADTRCRELPKAA